VSSEEGAFFGQLGGEYPPATWSHAAQGPPSTDAPVPPDDRVARRWVWLVLGTVLALAVVAIGLTGGLAPVPTTAAPSPSPSAIVQIGQSTAFDMGPAAITVTGAVVADDIGFGPADDGGHYLVVKATILVTDDITWEAPYEALLISGLPGLSSNDDVRLYSARDGTSIEELQPGITEPVAYTWQFKGTVPTMVTVLVQCYLYHSDADLHEHVFFDPAPCARTSVPVVDKRSAA
jgi:hypothetical protein